jgi:hypothetical protein
MVEHFRELKQMEAVTLRLSVEQPLEQCIMTITMPLIFRRGQLIISQSMQMKKLG